ncbi:MAG: hypothetical protein P8R54_27410 [Myxococcota bacterium]|nr:hypothetical protein [Myxococcota bacterium]
MKISYDEKDQNTLAQSFKRLRKSSEKKKVPFLWVESAMDGMPRLVAGAPGKGKVNNSIAAPLKKTAKNRANIAEGLAWRDPSKGITFSVLRGKFRASKAEVLIKKMEKAVGVRIGKICLHRMDDEEAQALGSQYVKENAAENSALVQEQAAVQKQIDMLASMSDSDGFISPEDFLSSLSVGDLAPDQIAVVSGGTSAEKTALGLKLLKENLEQAGLSPGEIELALTGSFSEQENLRAALLIKRNQAMASVIELDAAENNKLISGASDRAIKDGFFRRVFTRSEKPVPLNLDDEWAYDLQEHKEDTAEQTAEHQLVETGHSAAATMGGQALQLHTQLDEISVEIRNLGNSPSPEQHTAVEQKYRQLLLGFSVVERQVEPILVKTLGQAAALSESLITNAAFYDERLTFHTDDTGTKFWAGHDPRGETVNTWKASAESTNTQVESVRLDLDKLLVESRSLFEKRIAESKRIEDLLLRLQMTPARQEQLDTLLGERDERAQRQEAQETAQRLLEVNKELRRKERELANLDKEINDLSSSWLSWRSKNKSLKAEKNAELEALKKDIERLNAEKSASQEVITVAHGRVTAADDTVKKLEQELRDLELKLKKVEPSLKLKDAALALATHGMSLVEAQQHANALRLTIQSKQVALEEAQNEQEKATLAQRDELATATDKIRAVAEIIDSKEQQRTDLLREIADLTDKISGAWFARSRKKYQKRLDALLAKQNTLVAEIDTLSKEKLQWREQQLTETNIEESIEKLRLDSQLERTNAAEQELTTALNDAGLEEDEAAYKETHREQSEKEAALQSAHEKTREAEATLKILEQQKKISRNGVRQTEAGHNLAVKALKVAQDAAAANQLRLDALSDVATQAQIEEKLVASGDTLEALFPLADVGDNEVLIPMREAALKKLRASGIEDNVPLTPEQAKAVITAKKALLSKKQEQLKAATDSQQDKTNDAEILAQYAKLSKQKKQIEKQIKKQEEHLELVKGNIAKAQSDRDTLRLQRETLKAKADRAYGRISDAVKKLEAAAEGAETTAAEEALFALKAELAQPIEQYEMAKDRARQLSEGIKAGEKSVAKIKKDLGAANGGFLRRGSGLVGRLKTAEEKIDTLKDAHAELLSKFKPDTMHLKSLGQAIKDAEAEVEECREREAIAERESADVAKTLKAQEDAMLEKIRAADQHSVDDQKALMDSLNNLHHLYEQQDDLDAGRQIAEADILVSQSRDEVFAIHSSALAMTDELRESMQMFKDVEDIYEGTLNKKGAPSQLQKLADQNPEQYAVAMQHAEQVIADIERLKTLGESPEKYLLLLDPIPRAFWPDSLIAESKDFAEIEQLFVDEVSQDNDVREQIARSGIAHNLEDVSNVVNTLAGLGLCSADFLAEFAGATVNTAAVAWPIAGVVGALLSAADLSQDAYALYKTDKENRTVAKDAEAMLPVELDQLREQLQRTTLDKMVGLGEKETDFLYKTAFGAECILTALEIPVEAGSTAAFVPGVGVAASTIKLGYQLKKLKDAYQQASTDHRLEDEMSVDEDSAKDEAMRNSMRRFVQKSDQQKVTATIDAVGTASALAAQAGLLLSGQAAVTAPVIGWIMEATAGTISTAYQKWHDRSAAKKAKADLAAARAGSRRAMVRIFKNSELYATQLMIQRAMSGNSMAIKFCESRGLSKGDVLSKNVSQAILRKQLLGEDGQNVGAVKPSVRGMWDSLRSAGKLLEESSSGVQVSSPGPSWFNVQGRLVQAQLSTAARLQQKGAEAFPQQVASLQKLLSGYTSNRPLWQQKLHELQEAKRWQPTTFDRDKQKSLQSVEQALSSLTRLETAVGEQVTALQDGTIPSWSEISLAA